MHKLGECLCCGGGLDTLIDFGDMPLVNTYSVTKKYPLKVNKCASCYHLQLSEFVDPEILYRNYSYCSGTGRTAQDYFKSFAELAVSYYPKAKTVLDIASNDGSQLDEFKKLGLKTYGIDPAENLSVIAAEKGHEICSLFFEETKLDKTYDIITAQNVIAHTPDPLGFLRKCASIMDNKSRLFIATSQANLIVNGECDTIYHEHVSYFNSYSMAHLAEKSGLGILDILMHDIHGTSYVFVMGKTGDVHDRVVDRMQWELLTGMLDDSLYHWWRVHVEYKCKQIKETITGYKKKGYLLAGLGAAAKGLSILNMAGVKLDILFDTTPTKWFKTTNGIEIQPFKAIRELKQDRIAFVILPWNLRDEIKKNSLELRDNPDDIFLEVR